MAPRSPTSCFSRPSTWQASELSRYTPIRCTKSSCPGDPTIFNSRLTKYSYSNSQIIMRMCQNVLLLPQKNNYRSFTMCLYSNKSHKRNQHIQDCIIEFWMAPYMYLICFNFIMLFYLSKNYFMILNHCLFQFQHISNSKSVMDVNLRDLEVFGSGRVLGIHSSSSGKPTQFCIKSQRSNHGNMYTINTP